MRTALLALVLACGGCASVGPVVVEVSSDGAGALVVQRCNLHANFFAATMRFTGCKFDEIRVAPKPPRRTSWTITPDGQAREPDPD